MLKYILITNDPELAVLAEKSGVARIFVDLERLGKQERQGHLNTFISQHKASDVANVKRCLKSAELLVRLNPLNDLTENEIEEAISSGADLLMLPMFHTATEVELFSKMVAGRAGVIPLVETADAANAISEIVRVEGVTEIYIGLNDLHIDLNLDFMFELLSNGTVDRIVNEVKGAGLSFGFGGIARVGEGVIPGEMVLAEHLRLGSNSVILSRTFNRPDEIDEGVGIELSLKKELGLLARANDKLEKRSLEEVARDHDNFNVAVDEFVQRKNNEA